jgi:hypothetical protein
MEVVQHVRESIGRRFPGAEIHVDWNPEIAKVTGYVLWDGFERKKFITRQRLLFGGIRKDLGDDAQHVSIIFAHTPNEYEVMSAC